MAAALTLATICDAVADFPEVGNVMTSGVHQKWREDGISHHHGSERVVTLDKVRILDTEQDYFVRGVKEAVYIRAHQPSLNRDGGRYRLPATFDALLTSSRFRLPESQRLHHKSDEG
ncbi:hypothetical protein Bbelb_221280 [Branchiostoma belcheri]|nr:hypothetical protein Bbelb_221280 [Branchiostoma belcheri]